MEFPTYVYKGNGPFQRKGGTYNFAIVENYEEFQNLLHQGWAETLDQAIEFQDRPPEPIKDEVGSKLPTPVEVSSQIDPAMPLADPAMPFPGSKPTKVKKVK